MNPIVRFFCVILYGLFGEDTVDKELGVSLDLMSSTIDRVVITYEHPNCLIFIYRKRGYKEHITPLEFNLNPDQLCALLESLCGIDVNCHVNKDAIDFSLVYDEFELYNLELCLPSCDIMFLDSTGRNQINVSDNVCKRVRDMFLELVE